MKLIFLCGALEPGRDGVGDYTRRLAGELMRQGHECRIIALNDQFQEESRANSQECGGVSIPVLRLSARQGWSERTAQAEKWTKSFGPDWVSLQFVPFAYHPKGLPFFLGDVVSRIAGCARLHLMVHELWLGIDDRSTLKHRLWGWQQRRAFIRFLKKAAPVVIHTQAEPYRKLLQRTQSLPVFPLPLFSNIPLSPAGPGLPAVLAAALEQHCGKNWRREELYLAAVFGALYPAWDARVVARALQAKAAAEKCSPVLVFLGRSGLAPDAFAVLSEGVRPFALPLSLGEQSPAEVSLILQSADLGLATTPMALIQKSASTAVLLEQGLPVLVSRDDWRMRGQKSEGLQSNPRLITLKQFEALALLPRRNEASSISGLKAVALTFIADLQNAGMGER